jgi:2-alkyl-3-oxoalkanoate reductase
MRVFLAGATGAIGRRLLPQLIARGHQVTASTRSTAKVDQLRRSGVDPVVVDGLDAIAVREAVARAQPEVIIHQMSAVAGTPNMRRFDKWFATTNELRTRGTEHLLAAASASGVKRFVAQSYTGWTNIMQGGPIKSEDDPLDPHPARAQVRTLAAIRFLETAVLGAPLEGLALRYGNFYGPGASDTLVDLIRKRRMPIVGDGGGVWSWIHLDDAASATVAAVERGSPGIYNIVDDEPAPVSVWLPDLAGVVGARPPLHIPAWLGRLAAGEVVARWMTRGRGASNQKARRELGWQPAWPSWRLGFRQGLSQSLPTGAEADQSHRPVETRR